jgi:TrwC relaxase
VTMVTPRSGFDLEYYLDRTAKEKTAGGYYLNAALQGEPPGRWFGKGAEALGFTDGQQVERDPYLAAYQQTDANSGDKLGRAPNGYQNFRQIFARKLATEPHTTRERRLELEREAGQETRRSPVYTDLTVAHNTGWGRPKPMASGARSTRWRCASSSAPWAPSWTRGATRR